MIWSVRSTSPTSSFTFELARLSTRWSFVIGMLSSRRVCSPILTFLMFGMSMPGDEEDLVALLDQPEHHLVEVGRRVDDHRAAEGAQQPTICTISAALI